MFKEQINSFLEKEAEIDKEIVEVESLLTDLRSKKLAYKKARTALEKLEESNGQTSVSA